MASRRVRRNKPFLVREPRVAYGTRRRTSLPLSVVGEQRLRVSSVRARTRRYAHADGGTSRYALSRWALAPNTAGVHARLPPHFVEDGASTQDVSMGGAAWLAGPTFVLAAACGHASLCRFQCL
jgi:hypothetical protein